MYLTANMGPNGFGNEFVKLAKMLVCRKELNLPIAPAYWRSPYLAALPRDICYGTRMRRAWQLASDHLVFRRIRFGREEHRATGAVKVEEAMQRFMEHERIGIRDRVLVEFDGFEPGIETVEDHGPFLYDILRSVPDTAQMLHGRLDAFNRQQLWIGVHIRRGDFAPGLPLGIPWPEGQWNIQIPLEWYDRACCHLARVFHGRVLFFVTTNCEDRTIGEWCGKYGAVLSQPAKRRQSHDVVDVLTLAACDIMIGSASWFSGWPAVFRPKPWLWYSCAHGSPPWGRGTVFTYAGYEPELPEAFLAAAERALTCKGAHTARVSRRMRE